MSKTKLNAIESVWVVMRETGFGDIVAEGVFFSEVEANDFAQEHGSKCWVDEFMLFGDKNEDFKRDQNYRVCHRRCVFQSL
jgi:hypothetical protein